MTDEQLDEARLARHLQTATRREMLELLREAVSRLARCDATIDSLRAELAACSEANAGLRAAVLKSEAQTVATLKRFEEVTSLLKADVARVTGERDEARKESGEWQKRYMTRETHHVALYDGREPTDG